jgi:hypothetical protein
MREFFSVCFQEPLRAAVEKWKPDSLGYHTGYLRRFADI